MKNRILLALSLVGATACQTTTYSIADTFSLLENYRGHAQSLVQLIEDKGTNQEIGKVAGDLVKQSSQIINEFSKLHPQCDNYLDALNKAADIIPTLSLATIEADYHADGKLPAFSDPVCYHAKDLLVHPATVQAMANLGVANGEQHDQAKAEIVEVLGHFTQVIAAFKG